MKKMWPLALILLLTGCLSDKKSDSESVSSDGIVVNSDAGNTENPSDAQNASEPNGETVPHELRDQKNQLMAYVPLPVNWVMYKSGKATMSGPGDVFVYNVPVRNFMMSNDHYMAQQYQGNGGKLRPFTSAGSILQEDFVPMAERQGAKLLGIKNLPQVAKADKAPTGMLYTIGQRDYRYDAAIAEFEGKDGKPYAIIVHLNGTAIANTLMWNYYANILDAPKDRYEEAKEILLNALSGITYNPRYFDQYNAGEQQREASSWAAFNQRMQANWNSFNAQQAAFKSKNEAINNTIMGGYESRMASMDRNHNRFVNYIKGEETVRASDGSRHQVQTGSDHYYMNGDNKYIGTNDPNYDPNRDPAINNHNWEEVQVER